MHGNLPELHLSDRAVMSTGMENKGVDGTEKQQRLKLVTDGTNPSTANTVYMLRGRGQNGGLQAPEKGLYFVGQLCP